MACMFSGLVATPLLRGIVKDSVYQNILTTPDDMQQRIRQACVSIQPATCRAVIRSFGERLRMCINCRQEFNQTYYMRVLLFQTIAPGIPLPPQPVLTRWGTWLDAVNYYAEHYGKIMEITDALDSTDSSGVAAVKSLSSKQLLEDILFIDSNFKIVSKSITLLESSKLQLSEALNIVYKVSQAVIQNNNSLISEKVKCFIVTAAYCSVFTLEAYSILCTSPSHTVYTAYAVNLAILVAIPRSKILFWRDESQIISTKLPKIRLAAGKEFETLNCVIDPWGNARAQSTITAVPLAILRQVLAPETLLHVTELLKQGHRSQATKGNIEGGRFDPVLWIEFGVAQWTERLVRRTKDTDASTARGWHLLVAKFCRGPSVSGYIESPCTGIRAKTSTVSRAAWKTLSTILVWGADGAPILQGANVEALSGVTWRKTSMKKAALHVGLKHMRTFLEVLRRQPLHQNTQRSVGSSTWGIQITRNLHINQPDGYTGQRQRHVKDKRFGIKDRFKIGTWNVRGLSNKEEELNNELKRKHIEIAIIT
ncbi:hypothetical protein ANN_21119 [Periplaneta americana]|uniref:Uncharacterized protein n=1 Tax=Periplaneta americana TaxID=6978 RepID=A0ABQ8SF46_PERAM|nr:hypothetical protein ANN_21119 [Periplaneta americana]